LINFDNFSTIRNRNEYSTKYVQTVLLQPDCVSTLPGKTKNNTKQPSAYAVHSVEPIVPNFRRKSFSVHFFPCLLENFCSSLVTGILLHSRGFYQKLFSNLIWVILTCKLQLNCLDLWRVTVMTSSSDQVNRLHRIVECSVKKMIKIDQKLREL